jgi:hypothetical protein
MMDIVLTGNVFANLDIKVNIVNLKNVLMIVQGMVLVNLKSVFVFPVILVRIVHCKNVLIIVINKALVIAKQENVLAILIILVKIAAVRNARTTVAFMVFVILMEYVNVI